MISRFSALMYAVYKQTNSMTSFYTVIWQGQAHGNYASPMEILNQFSCLIILFSHYSISEIHFKLQKSFHYIKSMTTAYQSLFPGLSIGWSYPQKGDKICCDIFGKTKYFFLHFVKFPFLLPLTTLQN